MKAMNILNNITTFAFSLALFGNIAAATPAIETDGIIANGSGCPNADAYAYVSGSALYVSLPEMETELESDAILSRRFCQATINIYKPEGWGYRVKAVSYKAYLNVNRNATAQITTSVYEQGSAETQSQSLELKSFQGEINVNGSFDQKLSCDPTRALNLKTATNLKNSASKNGSAYVRQSGQIKVELEWFPCH